MAKDDERLRLLGYLKERFGIPQDIFKDYLLFRRKKSWQLIKNVSHFTEASSLKISKVGLKAFQKVGAFIKPTTRMIQIFGHWATKAVVEIDEEQLAVLMSGQRLCADLSAGKGYVILKLKNDRVAGLGFFINGEVASQISIKELRKEMLVR